MLPEPTIFTDEAPAYIGIAKEGGYQHKRIHHKARMYVEGDVRRTPSKGSGRW